MGRLVAYEKLAGGAATMRRKLMQLSDTENRGKVKPAEIAFEMQPRIDLELRLPTEEENPLEALVRIQISGKAALKDVQDQPIGNFDAEYEARFIYPLDAKESDVSPRFEREPYQYTLVSQAFPLASSHFRRELLAMGIDTRNLPLGL